MLKKPFSCDYNSHGRDATSKRGLPTPLDLRNCKGRGTGDRSVWMGPVLTLFSLAPALRHCKTQDDGLDGPIVLPGTVSLVCSNPASSNTGSSFTTAMQSSAYAVAPVQETG